MLTQYKILATFLVSLFIFAVFQLLLLFTLEHQASQSIAPANNLILEDEPSATQLTSSEELSATFLPQNVPDISAPLEQEAIVAVDMPSVSPKPPETEEPATVATPPHSNNRESDHNQPDDLTTSSQNSVENSPEMGAISQGCLQILEQSQDKPFNDQICVELHRDNGNQILESENDPLISFRLLNHDWNDDSTFYEFANLSEAGFYFALLYEANEVTWQSAPVLAIPTAEGYTVRFSLAEKKAQAPEEQSSLQTTSQQNKEESYPEASQTIELSSEIEGNSTPEPSHSPEPLNPSIQETSQGVTDETPISSEENDEESTTEWDEWNNESSENFYYSHWWEEKQ